MDALGELVVGALELVVDVLPFRVSAVIVGNVARDVLRGGVGGGA